MKKRYRMKCKNCNKFFFCSGFCFKHKKLRLIKLSHPERFTGSCICWDCDTANEEWKKDCAKEWKEFNPSIRDAYINEDE